MEDTSKIIPFENQSFIDPARKTAGAIYLEAQKNGEKEVLVGDLAKEFTKSLIDDLNDCIKSNPFENKEFYITVYEKKDLQMKSSILRRLYKTKYRPYPEDDTVVFKVDPKSNKVWFCWCLPHSTEMENILNNPYLYEKNFVNDVKAWKLEDLGYFGFSFINKTMIEKKENRDLLITN